MRVENGVIRKYFDGFRGARRERHLRQRRRAAPQVLSRRSARLVDDWSPTAAPRWCTGRPTTPYGRDIVSPPPGPFTPKYQFNFKEKEGDGSGFYDYGARLYNPATGRWLSPDSIVDDGPNRYTYVRNNPVLLTDLTGHQGCDGPAGTCPPPPAPATQPAAQIPDFSVPVPNLFEKVPAGLFSTQETNAMSTQTRELQGNVTNAYNFLGGYFGTLKYDTIDSFHMSNAWNVVSTMQVPGSPLQQAAASNSENAARYPIGGIQWGGVRTNSAANGSPSPRVALGTMLDTSGFSLHGITVQPGIYVGPFFNGTNLSAGGKAGVTASVDTAFFHFMYTSVEAYSTAAVNVNNARTTETTTGFRTENHFAATYDHAFKSGRHLTMQALGEPGQRNYVGAVQLRW